jgi:copper(I)-binding protein
LIVQSVFLTVGVLAAGPLMTASAAPPHATEAAASRSAVQVQVENAWIPQPPPGAEVAAAYFTLRNIGRESVVLVGVDCPLAAAAMLHESSVVAGESRMRMIERLTIPPEHSVTLKPGGLHVMLHEISSPLAVGQRVPLVLHFAGGKELNVEAKVRPLGSS